MEKCIWWLSQAGRTPFLQLSASISTTVDKSAGRLKCALAGFREELETWQSQHHQHCNTLKHHHLANNRLQSWLQGSTILHTFQDDIFLAQQCWSIPCMSFLPVPCSDPNSKLEIGSLLPAAAAIEQLATCRGFLPPAALLVCTVCKAVPRSAPRVIIVLSRPFVDSRLILCSLGLATLRLIG